MEFDGLGGSLLAAPQDVLEAVLQEVDAAALSRLKAVSVGWCAHARRELCNRLWVRLCRREGQPEPAGVDSITDLDVECLNEAGRPWEVVVAGRQLPQLARLHGYGFVVDLQAVREADPSEFWGLEEEAEDNDTLRSCIQGEGQPPEELLLAAVACAASGKVHGVPVQRLREDAIDEFVLFDFGIGDTAATLLALMLPASTSLRSLKLATAFACQCPLTRLVSHRPKLSHPWFLAGSMITTSGSRAPPPLLPSSRRRRSPCSRAPLPESVFVFVSAPIDTPRSRVWQLGWERALWPR